MRKIEAIVKPFQVEAVKDALTEVGVEGITAISVQGCGRQRGQMMDYRGIEYDTEFLPKVKIEIAVRDEAVPIVTQALMKSARSGRLGDGKIFVTPLNEAVRIRSGETGVAALD